MRLFRSRWGMRFLVMLLGAGLMPMIAAPAVQAMQPSRSYLYADWLRDQLSEPASASVEAALAAASATRSGSLGVFVVAFAEAFEAQNPAASLTDLFPLEHSSTEALLQYVYSRYQQVLGGVPVATARVEAAPSSPAGVSNRVSAMLPPAYDAGFDPAVRAFDPGHDTGFLAFPVRLSQAAQPSGP